MKLFTYPLFYCAIIIAALLLAVMKGCSEIRELKSDNNRLSDNLHSIIRKPSKTVTQYVVSKGEFKQLFPDKARLIDSLKLKLKRVVSLHTFKAEIRIDTVLVRDTVEILQGVNSWKYSQNCIDAEFFSDGRLKLNVTPKFNRLVLIDRPRFWFWRLKWNPEKWERGSTVESPCGWDVKENVEIIVK